MAICWVETNREQATFSSGHGGTTLSPRPADVDELKSDYTRSVDDAVDLANELLNAIMDALSAHFSMSAQALDSARVRQGIRDTLLGPGRLWEELRARGGGVRPAP
jgi:hypothetical protein